MYIFLLHYSFNCFSSLFILWIIWLKYEFWLKITIMVGIFIANIFLVCITTIKYANSIKDKQEEEVRRKATQIL